LTVPRTPSMQAFPVGLKVATAGMDSS